MCILIGLGANLNSAYGSPEQTLHKCYDMFASSGINIDKSSNIWRSAPVPISDQPWYFNAVCSVVSELSPLSLLEALMDIEGGMGRERGVPNAARVIDLDILSYNDEVISSEHLTLPHPRMHDRAFVLRPLHEIYPNWHHSALDKSVEEMLTLIPAGQKIERIENSQIIARTS